jgi:hypothetical protein
MEPKGMLTSTMRTDDGSGGGVELMAAIPSCGNG